MAIHINHRFIDRLIPNKDVVKINTIIIGTFNPGNPNLDVLSQEEKRTFEKIADTKKFQKFSLVKNFYDRPQNRLWKIFDVLHNNDFYSKNSLKQRNKDGLKFYSTLKMNRDAVFERQQTFCNSRGVFITDLVRSIKPKTFENIYDNFPDKGIENAECDWNTDYILNAINNFQPKHVLINFKPSKSIPKLSKEIAKLQEQHNDRIKFMLSTSGAAGNSYQEILKDWQAHF